MMLTMMCPNCRHRFLTPDCCQERSEEANQETEEEEKDEKEEEEKERKENKEMKDKKEGRERKLKKKKKITNVVHSAMASCYVGGLLMPRGCTSGGGCFINAPIVHVPAVFQSRAAYCGSKVRISGSETVELSYDTQISSAEENHHPPLGSSINDRRPNNQVSFIVTTENVDYVVHPEPHIASTSGLIGDSVTITTPSIQSGGCLIQSKETEILVQAPQIEIRPKLTGGGCLVQKRLSTEDERLTLSKYTKEFSLVDDVYRASNDCSKLLRSKEMPSRIIESSVMSAESKQGKVQSVIKTNTCKDCSNMVQQNQCHEGLSDISFANDRDLLLKPSGMQIRVNATVQLPANLGQCTVNITATTTTPPSQVVMMEPYAINNFNGSDIMESEELDYAMKNRIVVTKQQENNNCNNNNEDLRDEAPTTPVSWLMPSPWSLHADVNRLREVKQLLQICGWYHEGISWQQSENLLKNTSVGRWLMRDSSDSRYTFAISVQTARGPTSVRVHYFLEQFRLDAEPRLALAMPLFDCPIKMLEHYVEYSKKLDEHRREVWVDYSGQLYSQIYLTKPLVKEVRSLLHLARLTVNRNKLSTEHLPLLIKNYLAEYPYTL